MTRWDRAAIAAARARLNALDAEWVSIRNKNVGDEDGPGDGYEGSGNHRDDLAAATACAWHDKDHGLRLLERKAKGAAGVKP